MNEIQRQSLYRSIAISAGAQVGPISHHDRSEAFTNLEQFKHYDGRVAASVDFLNAESHKLVVQTQNTSVDITVATKLYALDIIYQYIKREYNKISDSDKVGLRWSVISAARQLVTKNENLTPDELRLGAEAETRILGMKIAGVIANFAVRDFPQKWTSFFADIFVSHQQGGIWGMSDAGNEQGGGIVGITIGLECLKIITEDCTDGDFNAKVSTARRNDVLKGLNEISSQLLPLLFKVLSEQYTLVSNGKQTLQQMNAHLTSNGITLQQLSEEERTMYHLEERKIERAGKTVADTLVTLEKFCDSMPLDWMFNSADFISVYLHLLRENVASLQVLSVNCLEALALRKLDPRQWLRLISSIPQAVVEANQIAQQRGAEKGRNFLVDLLPFHRGLSRMLALLISSHVAHITTDKDLIKRQGPKSEALCTFLRLLCEMLSHPSGRVCGEQINTWITLLRDPQISRSKILCQHLPVVLNSYITHMEKIRWDDVEEGIHPMANLIEASWDDKNDYDVWIANQRSKGTQLFKFIGNIEPKLAANVLQTRFQHILLSHGKEEPAAKCLTQSSEACMKFDGINLPFDNLLQGLPEWAVKQDPSMNDAQRIKIRESVRESLGQLASMVLTWTPVDPLLRLRRATFLSGLKWYWIHDSASLPNGVESLLAYLSAKDEPPSLDSSSGLSGETVALRKKAGISLVSISKHIPQKLVPWLSELSTRANVLLSTNDLLPPSRMHLYEFLTCVATAVDDSVVRANFVGEVLSGSLNTLDSNDMKEVLVSMDSFLTWVGVAQASSNPGSVTDHDHVDKITKKYASFFSSLNQLLSVGKRCHQAAKKRPNCGIPLQNLNVGLTPNQQNFPDEGPVSISDLSYNDPFVPLWPRLLPTLIRVIDLTFQLWHPSHQSTLLADPIQRYVFAISDDEVYLARKQSSSDNGGVFGEGGTAGSVVTGWDRRQANLAPRWSGWFNELRNTSLQLLGLLADQRVLFAPEIAEIYPRIVSVVCNPEHLRAMENRHFVQYMKQFIENLLVSCPSTMYHSHLSPILQPVLEHVQYRLAYTWAPIIDPNNSISTAALSTPGCGDAAVLASRGGEEWFASYYARGGVFVGELDGVTSEAVVEKTRVEVTRTFCDVVQSGLALKGEWALVLANQAKEEQAARKSDPSKLNSGPKTSLIGDGPVNADGTPRNKNQVSLEMRINLRIHKLCQFLLSEDDRVAGPLVLTIIQCMNYPDAYTCRRCTRISHRVAETTASIEQYAHILGYRLFAVVVKAIVTEPKWMVGIEWDMMALLRDLYCRLVLGQYLTPGGQGAGLQQPRSAEDPRTFEQSKNVSNPLLGGGILRTPSNFPRQILLELPGVDVESVKKLEENMTTNRSAKDQKDVLREMLRKAADELKQSEGNDDGGIGLLGRVVVEESVLSQNVRSPEIASLNEPLVTQSQVRKETAKRSQTSGVDVLGGDGLSTVFG